MERPEPEVRSIPHLVGEKSSDPPLDVLIAALAGAQGGVIDAVQLRRLGLSYNGITARRRRGVLHRMYHGVYSVGHAAPAFDGRAMAATLACGPRSALTGEWNAALRALVPVPACPPTVVAPRSGRRPGITVVRAALDPREIECVRGVPVTSVVRMLLGLAAAGDEAKLTRAWREAAFRRLLDLRAVDAQLGPGRPGARMLGELRERTRDGSGPERSDFEILVRRLSRSARLGAPRFNVMVRGASGRAYEVDIHWKQAGLIAELDGYEGHGTRLAFEDDRARDADLLVAGQRTIRLSRRRVEREWRVVAGELRALIGS